jgi:hypothetical protein
MAAVRYPALYQINTRVWLTELSETLGRQATLDDIADTELDRLAGLGFDWVWFLSVWQTGPAAQRVSRSNPQLRVEFRETLADLREENIAGSGFAITGYMVHTDLGGDAALARLRERLKKRGLRLMLDFVPNHVGLGHPWVEDHPDYFISGTERDLAEAPRNYTRVQRGAVGGQAPFSASASNLQVPKKVPDPFPPDLILAYGRDPYFPGWADTLQLNYANPALQETMMGELAKIAGQCDGVRCDMAMLVLPEVFERTWGRRGPPFWPTAIERVRRVFPNFTFLAEVYWDLERTMQEQGFDFTYDKRLYDKLREGNAEPVRQHFQAGLDYQNKLVRFLENHDEPRATATFSSAVHQAAAVITFLSPGMRFFHQGQLEGKRIRISPHLARGPTEPIEPQVKSFYDKLLGILRRPVFGAGQWQLLDCTPAWEGDGTHECFVVFAWQGPAGERIVVAVNYAANQSQCHVRLLFADLAGKKWRLQDLLSPAAYDWNGDDLIDRGLFLNMTPWQANVFSVDHV